MTTIRKVLIEPASQKPDTPDGRFAVPMPERLRRALGDPIGIGIPQLFLFASFSLVYAALAPDVFQQDWDSLMYGYWSEVNGIRSIWGNHPLGHLVLNSVYAVASGLGYDGKALPLFIICNSVFGGAAVALLYGLTRTLQVEYWTSLGCAIVFGASYGLWHYSGTADVYSISVLFLLLAWLSLVSEVLVRQHRHLYVSGVLAGLSALCHQLNAAFLPVALIVILSRKEARWTRAGTFYVAALATALAGWVLLAYLATSSFSISAMYTWARGYLGDPVYGDYLKLESIPMALNAAMGTLLAPAIGRARFVRMALLALLAGTSIIGLAHLGLLDRGKKSVLLAALSQCSLNSLLILWFEPWYPKFWLLTLVPGIIVLGCSTHALGERLAPWLARLGDGRVGYSVVLVILGLIMAVFNVRYALLNEHSADGASQQALGIWLQHSQTSDMLITAGDLIPQLWFWADRPSTIHLYHYLEKDQHSDDRFAYLRSQIHRFICDGNAVIYAPAIIENFGGSFLQWLELPRDDLRAFFDEYRKERYFTYRNLINGSETQVYRLLDPTGCAN